MQEQSKSTSLSRSIGALGVVYGDIGTSVLYAFKQCLEHGLDTPQEIIGVLSLIIWSLFTLVSVKYLAIVMRADNQGEGGILALLSLAFPKDAKVAAGGMIAVGIAGASLSRWLRWLAHRPATGRRHGWWRSTARSARCSARFALPP